MHKKLVKVERTITLADRLLDDIQQRKLTEGDPYFTTVEAAEFLKVSGASANRALQMLVKRKVLVRSQKKGAIIIDPQKRAPAISHVHFLFESGPGSLNNFQEGIIHGVREEMPLSHVAYSILSIRSKMDEIMQLIARAGKSNETYGFIMINTSQEVQKQIGRCGIPCVLLGSRCPGVPSLSSLDIAREAPLRILADFLHRQKRNKVALLMPKNIHSGDVITVNAALRMDLPYCFFMQHSKDDPELVDEICELVDRRFAPDGFVCYNVDYANAVVEAMKRIGKSLDDVDITVMSELPSEYRQQFTHVNRLMNVNLIGRRLGQLLYASAIGIQPQNEEIPVKLVCPLRHSQGNMLGLENEPSFEDTDWTFTNFS